METLVQNLLKITRLDAGAVVLEKATENIADMLRDIELHFAYRAKQEQKKIILNGTDDIMLFCDRECLSEAIDNIVKNALDHTEKGDTIQIEWRALYWLHRMQTVHEKSEIPFRFREKSLR